MTKRCLLLCFSCLLVLTGCITGKNGTDQGWVSKTGLYHFAYHQEESRIGALSLDERFQLAKESDRYALFNLGMLYLTGVGVDEDLEKAQEWFLKSAQAGHIGAVEFLSESHRYELTAKNELRVALENALQGKSSPFKVNSPYDRARIQALLALDYSKGNGQIDEPQLIQIHDVAVQQGDVEAILKRATIYLNKSNNDAKKKALEGLQQFEVASKGKLPPYMELAKARLEDRLDERSKRDGGDDGVDRYALAVEVLKKAVQAGEGASLDWIMYAALLRNDSEHIEGGNVVKIYTALSIGVLKNVEVGMMDETGAYFIFLLANMAREALSASELEEAKTLTKQCMKNMTKACY